ncbi:uncharacterized protein LOC127136696 [Lathyrus oleraceus]|uniref:uncharacterized protein LOC127136696 n=1 Tax=Pisum sativum TaxID=3888 RepID=UPI0021D32249|nr:uncharacterized protein LOC127136696 [Pisum sativum]
MSQHQNISASKITKSTQKVSAPPMDIPDDEILDVVPLSVIPCEALDLNHPIDASASACSDQGNSSCIPSGSTPTTNSKEDIHHTDRVIRNLVTRILNEGHSVKGVSTPLSQMHPSPEVEQHSEKGDDSSSSKKDMVAEGLCSLGQTVSDKGKYVAAKTANASHFEKHDDANDVIDLEDDRSDDQEDNLLCHLKPSVAKRMKTRKGRSVAELMSARKAKKTVGIGPSKSWSKWKFVIQRRVVVERELGKDVADVKEVKDLIKAVGLLKIVVGFSQCYEGLVKEFIVDIPEDIADKNSKEFCKVFVRGRKIEGAGELEATDNKVYREITTKQVKGWPIKKHLPVGKLTLKYAILHKIGAANWVPTNHISTIDNTLGRFIFASGTKPTSKVGIIVELKETCKELGEGIRVATARKQSLEALIASLEQAEGENIEHAKEVEAHTSSERSADNDETSGNYVSGAAEAASSSSTD